MKIGNEDTPESGDSKRTLAEGVAKFLADHEALHQRYVGYRFDAAYRREIERLESELGAAVQNAPAITSMQEAASLLAMECMLFREFEGEKPEGIHATRLMGLEAVRSFLCQQSEVPSA